MVYVIIALAVVMVLGGLLCFRGKKLFYPLMSAVVFQCGVAICMSLFERRVGWVAGSALGAALVAIARKARGVLWFAAGAVFGFIVGAFAVKLFGGAAEKYQLYIELALALLMGICAYFWHSQLIVICTAGIGACALATGTVFLIYNYRGLDAFDKGGIVETLSALVRYIGRDFGDDYSLTVFFAAVVFFMAGLAAQFAKKPKRASG